MVGKRTHEQTDIFKIILLNETMFFKLTSEENIERSRFKLSFSNVFYCMKRKKAKINV